MKKIVLFLVASFALVILTTSYIRVIPGPPSFTVSLVKMQTNHYLPSLQSFAWATAGSKLLLIGGRTEGFHGLTNDDTTFKIRKANDSIFVIDMQTLTYAALAIDKTNPALLQFSSSNMEFKQDGDTLYLVKYQNENG